MYTVLVVIHVIVCVLLSIVVMLQSSKGSGLAGAFGGGGGLPQQIFGTRGVMTLLHKMTIYLAAGFFLTSAVLFATSSRRVSASGSIVGEAAREGRVAPPPLTTDAFDPSAAPAGGTAPGAGAAPASPAPAGQGSPQQPGQ